MEYNSEKKLNLIDINNNKKENEEKDKKETIIYPSSFLSEIFSSWSSKVLEKAKKQTLEIEDLGNFSETQKAKVFFDEIYTLTKKAYDKSNKRKKKNAFAYILKEIHKKSFILIIISSIILTIINLFTTFLFHQILLNFEVKDIDNEDDDIFNEILFDITTSAILMIICKFLYIIILRYLNFYTSKVGAKTIIQIYALLYKKLLKISTYTIFSEGELLNLIQIDSEKFAEFFSSTPGAIIIPFEICGNLYFLFKCLGLSFTIGFVTILLIFPFAYCLEGKRLHLQKEFLFWKDKRLKTVTQIFENIKSVKLYTLENFYFNKVKEIRIKEFETLKKNQIYTMINNSIFWSISEIVCVISIFSFNLLYDNMNISNILTSLYIINNLSEPLFNFPSFLAGLFDSIISLKRIDKFLFSREWSKCNIDSSGFENDKAIKFEDISFGIISNKNQRRKSTLNFHEETSDGLTSEFDLVDLSIIRNRKSIENIPFKKKERNSYEQNQKIIFLKHINFNVDFGDKLCIIGDIGSGKTCLINSILSNLDIVILNLDDVHKRVVVNGKIAYVPQTPFIINETIQNNILFYKKLDIEKYNKIIDICQLKQDFDLFVDGDYTEIGDKGTNISSGQKSRIAIARALYSDSDIYLFDDPFSKLDAYVFMNIFNKVINEYLKDKTVIIATHSLKLIPLMKHVCYLNEGNLEWYGTNKEAIQQEFYKSYCRNSSKNLLITNYKKYSYDINPLENTEDEFNGPLIEISSNNKRIRKNSNKKKSRKLLKKEDNKFNQSIFITYINFFKLSGGYKFVLTILMSNICWKFFEFLSDYILSYWSSINYPSDNLNEGYLSLYSFVSFLAVFFIFQRTFFVVEGMINYNKTMHDTLLIKCLNAPINLFHDIIPRGQILNRMGKDLDNSTKFFWNLNGTFHILIHLFSCYLFIAIFNYYAALIIIIIIPFQILLWNFYNKGSNDLNKIEGQIRSSLINRFSETLNGISTIRGYEYQNIFENKYFKLLDDFYKILIFQSGTSNWVAIRIDLISFGLLFFILIFVIVFQDYLKSVQLGLVLNYTIKIVNYSFNFFEQFSVLQKYMMNIERCESFTKIIQERDKELPNDEKLKLNGFPYKGKLEFKNYSVKYRIDSELILHNINFIINPGEKIGIVGRTGSGKSTLCLSLFRILEATSGKILIDDVDISTLGLNFLREILTVIPQEPILIDGSLRENLDLENKYTDEEIEAQLQQIGIDYLIQNDGLDKRIIEYGYNLSIGEKQLICLTRAILKKNKIIIMDEATSSVDYKTEMLIQKSIETCMKDCTIITIAHKIKTIMKYDRIFVIQDGELVQNDSPLNLIKNKRGIFYELYSESKI